MSKFIEHFPDYNNFKSKMTFNPDMNQVDELLYNLMVANFDENYLRWNNPESKVAYHYFVNKQRYDREKEIYDKTLDDLYKQLEDHTIKYNDASSNGLDEEYFTNSVNETTETFSNGVNEIDKYVSQNSPEQRFINRMSVINGMGGEPTTPSDIVINAFFGDGTLTTTQESNFENLIIPYETIITSNTGRLDILEPIVNTNTTNISTNTTNISTNTTNIGENSNRIDTNSANIQAIEGQITPSNEIVAKGVSGTVLEGVWTPIAYNDGITDSFDGITIEPNGNITITVENEITRFLIRGQSFTTGTNKIIKLRLWDITNNTQYGNESQIEISNIGIAQLSDSIIDLPIGSYRVEVFGEVSGGDISFTNYTLDIFTLGSTGTVGLSSEIIDDSADLPNVGINLWKGVIDNNQNEIESLRTLTPLMTIPFDAGSITETTEITLLDSIANYSKIIMVASPNETGSYAKYYQTIYTELIKPGTISDANNEVIFSQPGVNFETQTVSYEYNIQFSFDGANKIFVGTTSRQAGYINGIYGIK